MELTFTTAVVWPLLLAAGVLVFAIWLRVCPLLNALAALLYVLLAVAPWGGDPGIDAMLACFGALFFTWRFASGLRALLAARTTRKGADQ